MQPTAPRPDVVAVCALRPGALDALLAPWGLVIEPATGEIPGSYWGESEAGLIGNRLVLRPDTPVHSALHEACHWICAKNRDAHLFPEKVSVPFFVHTDAGGDDLEECAVCYLQILLADKLPGYSREQMLADMDAWGYSFRLGSTRAWFERDAGDARAWLAQRALLT
ncbi:MAG: hypothetical protein ACT4PK_02775 [Gammaproteobacteria bacterium]